MCCALRRRTLVKAVASGRLEAQSEVVGVASVLWPLLPGCKNLWRGVTWTVGGVTEGMPGGAWVWALRAEEGLVGVSPALDIPGLRVASRSPGPRGVLCLPLVCRALHVAAPLSPS